MSTVTDKTSDRLVKPIDLSDAIDAHNFIRLETLEELTTIRRDEFLAAADKGLFRQNQGGEPFWPGNYVLDWIKSRGFLDRISPRGRSLGQARRQAAEAARKPPPAPRPGPCDDVLQRMSHAEQERATARAEVLDSYWADYVDLLKKGSERTPADAEGLVALAHELDVTPQELAADQVLIAQVIEAHATIAAGVGAGQRESEARRALRELELRHKEELREASRKVSVASSQGHQRMESQFRLGTLQSRRPALFVRDSNPARLKGEPAAEAPAPATTSTTSAAEASPVKKGK